jgi:hypothetical protein
MLHWKMFLRFFKLRFGMVGVLLLCLYPLGLGGDCGPNLHAFQGYSFLRSNIIKGATAGAPYVLGFDVLYERYGVQKTNMIQDNLDEWHTRYCARAEKADIYAVVYEWPSSDLEEVLNGITVKGYGLSPYLRQNTFANYLYSNGCSETLRYLQYVRDCEPHVTTTDPWENQPSNTAIMNSLILRGRDELLLCNSHYIRLRYAFQIIRLSHYSKQYKRTVELYEWLMPKVDNDPSLIEYWILGHRAGALHSLGRYAEAAYDYVRIFLNCPSKRESALQSFQIRSDEEWQQTYKMCQSDQERATMYAMRAYLDRSRALEEMKLIYALDPKIEYLDVLLVRELRRLEKQLLGLEFNPHREQNRRYQQIPQAGIDKYLIQLQEFVQQLNVEKTVKNRELWAIAEGYLEMISGDFYAALKSFERSENKIKDEQLKEQLEIFKLGAQIGAYQDVNDEMEDAVERLMRNNDLFLRFPSKFEPFTRDKLGWLYKRYNMPGKAFLAHYSFQDLRINPREKELDDLQAMLQQQRLNRMERKLLRQGDSLLTLNDIHMLKATVLLDQYLLIPALEEIKKIDRNAWSDYGVWAPFVERFRDCVHCPIRDTVTFLNRGEIIERMLDLEYRALANRLEGGIFFYQMGLAYYNMSYFGSAWPVMDNFRSGTSLKRRKSTQDPSVVTDERFALGNREHFDCTQALNYFKLARQFASSREFAARATFMAARCEQNNFYWQGGPRTYEFFEALRREYADTQFYARIVAECKYFNFYTARN